MNYHKCDSCGKVCGRVKNHICKKCKKAFCRKMDLKNHNTIVHKGGTLHECKFCKKKFDKLNFLKYHINVIHFGETDPTSPATGSEPAPEVEGKFTCSMCEQTFGQYSEFKNHMLYVHKTPKNFQCSECDEAFCHKIDLKNHMLYIHKSPKNWKCIYCDDVFCFRSGIRIHMAKFHEGMESHKCKCAICDKFVPVNRFTHHIKIYHDDSKEDLKCEICGKIYGNSSELKYHIMKSHIDPLDIENQIEVPKETLDNDYELEPELSRDSSVEEERPLMVQEVMGSIPGYGKIVRQVMGSIPDKKMEIKENKPQIQCLYCPETFEYFSDFTNHMKVIHECMENMGKCKCGICLEVLYIINLKNHLKEYHKVTFNNETQTVEEIPDKSLNDIHGESTQTLFSA